MYRISNDILVLLGHDAHGDGPPADGVQLLQLHLPPARYHFLPLVEGLVESLRRVHQPTETVPTVVLHDVIANLLQFLLLVFFNYETPGSEWLAQVLQYVVELVCVHLERSFLGLRAGCIQTEGLVKTG